MKRTMLQNAMAIGILAVASGYALQASAGFLPSFTFIEVAGFNATGTNNANNPTPKVDYSGAIACTGGPECGVNAQSPEVFSTMSWRTGDEAQSSLELETFSGNLGSTPTNISLLTHNNFPIPAILIWGPQNIWGRFIVTEVGEGQVMDDTSFLTISFNETDNKGGGPEDVVKCDIAPPNNTACDDFFTLDASQGGLASLPFVDSYGSNWQINFTVDTSACDGIINKCDADSFPTIFTGERGQAFIYVTAALECLETDADGCMQPNKTPEPSMLALLGLGLLGLGFGGWGRRRRIV